MYTSRERKNVCHSQKEKGLETEPGGDTKYRKKWRKRNKQQRLGRYGQKVRGFSGRHGVLEVTGDIFFLFFFNFF